jgi:acyl carrier protein
MSVEERMLSVFREVLDDDELVVTDNTTAAEIEAWDSLAHINLMYALESEFEIQFSDEQLTSFHNVGELRRFLSGAINS